MPTFSEIRVLLSETSNSEDEVIDNRYLLGPTQNELGSAYDDGSRVNIRAFHKLSPDLVYVFSCRASQVLTTINGANKQEPTPLKIIKALVVSK